MSGPSPAFADRAPWWGGDLQTLRNFVLHRQVVLPSVATALAFPVADGSGDRLTGTLEEPLKDAQAGPLIVLIHGLTGCEDSQYIRESARFHLAHGRKVLRLNLRGAGSSRRVASGFYHAGCAGDLQAVLAGLDPRHGARRLPRGLFARRQYPSQSSRTSRPAPPGPRRGDRLGADRAR